MMWLLVLLRREREGGNMQATRPGTAHAEQVNLNQATLPWRSCPVPSERDARQRNWASEMGAKVGRPQTPAEAWETAYFTHTHTHTHTGSSRDCAV